jgi:hypothetical protein
MIADKMFILDMIRLSFSRLVVIIRSVHFLYSGQLALEKFHPDGLIDLQLGSRPYSPDAPRP